MTKKKKRTEKLAGDFNPPPAELLPEEERLEYEPGYHEGGEGGGERHAMGTPGGGSEIGGLAGTNIGDGAPGNSELDEYLGSSEADQHPDDVPYEGPPYSGRTGGAVGGTPAEGRAAGGQPQGGIAGNGVHRGDSTIGATLTPEESAQTGETPKKTAERCL